MKATSSPHEYLNLAIEELKHHDLDAARRILGDSLYHHFDNATLLGMTKYIAFWQEREKLVRQARNDFQKCDILRDQWPQFLNFCNTIQFHDDQGLFGIRQYVFGSALEYLSSYNNEQGLKDPEILFRVGQCLKVLGNYPSAQKFLESANALKRNSPAILAEMADTYAFLEENDMAKLLFREAFTLDPQEIRLEFLESALIRRVISLVIDEGHTGSDTAEWVPVFGYVEGVLSTRRELRAVEFGKLLHTVYQLEREILEQAGAATCQIPRVINKYFWLIDHYSRSRDDQPRIKELILKIKGLSRRIYELYTR